MHISYTVRLKPTHEVMINIFSRRWATWFVIIEKKITKYFFNQVEDFKFETLEIRT